MKTVIGLWWNSEKTATDCPCALGTCLPDHDHCIHRIEFDPDWRFDVETPVVEERNQRRVTLRQLTLREELWAE